jgi:hypothetical protein
MSTSQPIRISLSKKKDNLLQPLWLGKIDWSHGIPTSPETYKAAQDKIFEYWGEYKSPVWDDMYEYRKTFSTRNYNSYNSYNPYNLYDNYENISNLQDKENQFITISKNKKTIKKIYSYSSEVNKFSSNYSNQIDSEISDSENNNFYYNNVNNVNDVYKEDVYKEDNF